MLRSIAAVLAGIAVLTALSFAIEAAVNPLLLRLFPQALPDSSALLGNKWMKVFTFTYGILCVTAGGYVTAWVAKRLPMQHAAAMGAVQMALTLVAMLSPESYRASQVQWIFIAIFSAVAALAGGFLYKKRTESAR